MWFFGKKEKAKTEGVVEERAGEASEKTEPEVSDVLLRALLGGAGLTKEEARQIPAVTACIDYIAGTVASIPIKLYEQQEENVKEIRGDRRVFLLNNDTGDTLTARQFWRAILDDYYLGTGGYAYINRRGMDVRSIHYVDCESVSTIKNEHPIFKDYDIYVQGGRYLPFQFLKFLRKTKDGCRSVPVMEENRLIFEVAYQTLVFERALVKKGGNKKGFLKAAKKISEPVMDKIKEAFRNLYSNNQENVIVLNDGIDFKESSNTSVEMQLNENKESNAETIAAIFKVPMAMLLGKGTKEDRENYIRFCILPLLEDLECSLDRDLLLEREKESMYFAFDTKELTRGSIEERYRAYEIGLQNNFLQVDEVRDKEDLEPLGIQWIRLGLDSVLYDYKSQTIYTPNTNETRKMNEIHMKEGEKNED